MTGKKRLDQYLVENKLAESRTRAQNLIDSGSVMIVSPTGQKTKALKASLQIPENHRVEILEHEQDKYVSRGGFKLEGALAHLQQIVNGKTILDIGLSTGGFSDCLLQFGAKKVVGVDVGHQQTHPKLLKDNRLEIFEGINARQLSSYSDLVSSFPNNGFDLIVMDVSFISITLIIPEISQILRSGQILLSLVKPQFEVGQDGLGKGGIVKDPSLYEQVESKIKSACRDNDLNVLDYFQSSIEGKDGNKEFFIYAQKN